MKQETMVPTRKIGVGVGVRGTSTSTILTVFLMFGLGRYFGGEELIPRDVLEIVPYVVLVLTNATSFIAGYFTEDHGKPT